MAGYSVTHVSQLGRASDWKAYLDTLKRGHTVRTRAYVMDSTEQGWRGWDISPFITGGQIDMDTSQEPSRVLSLTVLDAEHNIAVTDPAASMKGGLWIGSIIQVWYDVAVPELETWVECPVFTGPVAKLERQGAEVTIGALGKEAFLVPPSAYNNVFSKTNVTASTKSRRQMLVALLDAVGEPQVLDWQGDTGSLPKHFDPVKSFRKADSDYLKFARQIVGESHQFFYDGEGRPRVRSANTQATTNLAGLELTEASSSFDLSEVRNRARTTMQKNPAHKAGNPPSPVVFTSTRQPNDPLSAQSLQRNGVPRYLDADSSGSDFKAEAQAKKAGLAALGGYSEDVNVDIIPVPFLNPFDYVQVEEHGQGSGLIRFKVRKFSFPLHAGDSMSLGYTRRILDPKHAKVRHRTIKQKHGKRP